MAHDDSSLVVSVETWMLIVGEILIDSIGYFVLIQIIRHICRFRVLLWKHDQLYIYNLEYLYIYN
jgi:hypothetical protein